MSGRIIMVTKLWWIKRVEHIASIRRWKSVQCLRHKARAM